MTIFLESPWPAMTAAIGLEVALVIFLAMTGRGWLMGPMAGVALVALGLVGLERLVVTDRELVSDALDGIAGAVAKNDIPAVLTHISPQAITIRQEIPGRLGAVVGREARVNDLKVDVKSTATPPTATARFIGRIEGTLKRGSLPHEVYIARFEVYFEKQDEKWLVTGYREIR